MMSKFYHLFLFAQCSFAHVVAKILYLQLFFIQMRLISKIHSIQFNPTYSCLDFRLVVFLLHLAGYILRHDFPLAECDRTIRIISSVNISMDHTLEFPMGEYPLLLSFCNKFAHTDRKHIDTTQRTNTMTVGAFVAETKKGEKNQIMPYKKYVDSESYGLPCGYQGYPTCLQL